MFFFFPDRLQCDTKKKKKKKTQIPKSFWMANSSADRMVKADQRRFSSFIFTSGLKLVKSQGPALFHSSRRWNANSFMASIVSHKRSFMSSQYISGIIQTMNMSCETKWNKCPIFSIKIHIFKLLLILISSLSCVLQNKLILFSKYLFFKSC